MWANACLQGFSALKHAGSARLDESARQRSQLFYWWLCGVLLVLLSAAVCGAVPKAAWGAIRDLRRPCGC